MPLAWDSFAAFPLLPSLAHWWEHNSSKLTVALLLAAAFSGC